MIALPRTRVFAVAGIAVVAMVGITGCVGAGSDSPASSSPAIDAGGSQPATAPTAPPAADASGSSASAAPKGCAPTPDATMPPDADSAVIRDIDGDGRSDTEWFSETSDFSYGITTASGATFSIPNELAGPGKHSGWTAVLGNGAIVTVLADGRTAMLRAVVDCGFVAPVGVDGKPYIFDMQNLRGNGTGVGCIAIDGKPHLGGYQMKDNGNGTSTVTFTEVKVDPDGSSATNGPTTALSTDAGPNDPLLAQAQSSSCLDTPIVATSGR